MKLFSRIATTFVLSSLLISAPTSASNETLSDDRKYAFFGPEFKYISSDETVPDEDKLVAALQCDGDFETAWLERNGKGDSSVIIVPEVAAAVAAMKLVLAGGLSRIEKKELYMTQCLAEKDMVQSDQTKEVWWPGRD